LFDNVIASPGRPIPVRAIGPKGGVGSMLRLMFTQFQGLFLLTNVRKGKSLNIKIRNAQTRFQS
jgi:hypothetical protein